MHASGVATATFANLTLERGKSQTHWCHCDQADLGKEPGSLGCRSKKIKRRVIYCDAFLAKDARSQVVNGLLSNSISSTETGWMAGRAVKAWTKLVEMGLPVVTSLFPAIMSGQSEEGGLREGGF